MNGSEHYREAERILALVSGVAAGDPQEAALIAEAQVHATLALAAATAQNIRRNGAVEVEAGDWSEVLS